jgi:rfaE bifunctional protein kinase chain/domain
MPEPRHDPAPLSAKDIASGLEGFQRLAVVVVGDLFLDEYIEGEMFEISKEGPIPVIRIESKTQTAGAAGNLASSLRNLGANVSVVGIVGDDPNGRVLVSQLQAKGIDVTEILVHPEKPTLTYSKVRARVTNTPSREIFRMDVLPDAPLDGSMETRLLEAVRRASAGAKGIIVLDQIHHLVTRRLLGELPAMARASGALLHGSSREHIREFHDFDLITPNDREAQLAVGGDGRDVERLGRELQSLGGHKKVMLTLGADGMALFAGRGGVERVPTYARQVLDVTGAGDAVSAVALLGNILGWDLKRLAWAASHAAAIAVEHVGTHHVTAAELKSRVLESR